ncbi:transcription factor adf-1 [Plakobranchus ocellatus]|uniref:Transcription factor adf-1 n=1 Tax=Plakobranchus ocellatus TaxID=259542 RepID=A0AAV3ZE69_9GAST|nr:transcription factor adf-1 [Plakobranchus ocellatus]
MDSGLGFHVSVNALIDSVRKRPAIWDRSNEFYSRRQTADTCWRDISKELNYDEFQLRKKWKYLRDNFSVEYGKTLSEGPHGGRFVSRWHYYSSLTFLKSNVTPRSSVQTGAQKYQTKRQEQLLMRRLEQELEVDHSSREDSKETIPDICTSGSSLGTSGPTSELREAERDEDLSDVGSRENQETDRLNHPNTETSLAGKGKKRKPNEGVHFYKDMLDPPDKKTRWVPGMPSSRTHPTASEADDHDIMFFKSLLPHVRLIAQHLKLRFQIKVQELVQEFAYAAPSSPERGHRSSSGSKVPVLQIYRSDSSPSSVHSCDEAGTVLD